LAAVNRKFEMVIYLAAAVMMMLFAAGTSAPAPRDIGTDVDLETARPVKDYYAEWLSSIPGVTAVTVGHSDQGQPEIMIGAAQMTPQLKQIPTKLNGIPVVIAPSRPAEGESLSSQPLSPRGFMPTPTPEVEIKPAPTPQGNKFWPTPIAPDLNLR
jgi:hypothetical protein